MISRRRFIGTLSGAVAGTAGCPYLTSRSFLFAADSETALFRGKRSQELYKLLGSANEFKEGDESIGIAATSQDERTQARRLLGQALLRDIDSQPLFGDRLGQLLHDRLPQPAKTTGDWTIRDLKRFLLDRTEAEIKQIMPGLSSDVIGCVVKLMSNDELIVVGAKVFNPLPGSQIGAKGYLGARIQPNSPTDHLDDIRWQVLDGWSYAVGDVVLGNNPVSSEPDSVAAIEHTLKDLLVTFELTDVLPHCVLSHIDVQAEVEQKSPGSTALWFQSIAGTDAANQTFDISIEKMMRYANSRGGRYGLYFETGQGADLTNGHSHGFDMVLHESRKYGFARALKQTVGAAQKMAGSEYEPWVHLNDVAGFIGPEVFRSKEQLVRCCLEDIVMGKLHGLCIGLDVCSTLHMDVSLDDLDWCLDRIMPANPAYLMALPTKIDPMLGYLTTGYQDHVRLREKFGFRVNDRMWKFFQELEVIGADGSPTEHFGDPLWVFQKYRRRKGDQRSEQEILAEGRSQIQAIRDRGVFIATGHGEKPGDLEPTLERDIRRIYDDAKESIWAEQTPQFIAQIPDAVPIKTQSIDRTDYILHPVSGETLSPAALKTLAGMRERHGEQFDAQIVISDGLNSYSIMDEGHLGPFLKRVREKLAEAGFHPARENFVITSGRVRAGYRVGEALFGNQPRARSILHVIGERPGSGHHTFSIYITSCDGSVWGQPGKVDHNITKVVSGVAVTSLAPEMGADQTVRLLQQMTV